MAAAAVGVLWRFRGSRAVCGTGPGEGVAADEEAGKGGAGNEGAGNEGAGNEGAGNEGAGNEESARDGLGRCIGVDAGCAACRRRA